MDATEINNIDELIKLAASINSYKKNNKNIPDELLNYALKADPTYIENSEELGKFTDWILKKSDIKEFIKNFHPEDLKLFINTLIKGSKNPNSPLYQKTLNDFNTLQDLKNATFERKNDLEFETEKDRYNRIKKEMKNTFEIDPEKGEDQYNIIYENPETNLRIIQPLTTLASCYFGKGTNWCTSTLSQNNMFESYTKHGNFYVAENLNTGEKFGIQPETQQFQNYINSQANLPLFVLNYREIDPEFLEAIEKIYPYSFSKIAEMSKNEIYETAVEEGNDTIEDLICKFNRPLDEYVLNQLDLDEDEREEEKQKYYESLKKMVHVQYNEIKENVPEKYLIYSEKEYRIKHLFKESITEEEFSKIKEEDKNFILSKLNSYRPIGHSINKDGSISVGGDLELQGTSIQSLPEGLTVGGSLDLKGTQIQSLPEGLVVGRNLYLQDTPIQSLPKGLKVVGDLDLRGTQIQFLPEGLTVGGSLKLQNTQIQSLPEGLSVRDLYLQGSQIQSLPENLSVGGDLNLSDTPIQSLPEGLNVGGYLFLSETPIQSLPENLNIGDIIRYDHIDFYTTESLRDYLNKKFPKEQPQELTESSEEENFEFKDVENLDQLTEKKKEAIEFPTNPFEVAKNLVKDYGGKAIDYAKGLGSGVVNSVKNLLNKDWFEMGDLASPSLEKMPSAPAQPVAVTEQMLQEQPEVIPKPKVKKKKPEYIIPDIEAPEIIVYNHFIPDIWENAELMEGDADNWDTSINVLSYLKELGYTRAYWMLGPEYDSDNCLKLKYEDRLFYGDDELEQGDDIPICLWNSNQTWSLEGLIGFAHSNADRDGYYPPKTIVSNSHPRCHCSIVCEKPASADQIPDSAPGLPSGATGEELKKYKETLFNQLTEVTVDRFTFLIPELWKSPKKAVEEKPFEEKIERIKASSEERIVLAKEEWQEEIRPITIVEDFVYKYPLNIVRAIPKSYIGFQLETKGDQSKIYLSHAGMLTIPKSLIKEITLVPSVKERPDANTFVMIGDDLGIVLKYELYEDTICYVPAFDSIMKVDDLKVLDIADELVRTSGERFKKSAISQKFVVDQAYEVLKDFVSNVVEPSLVLFEEENEEMINWDIVEDSKVKLEEIAIDSILDEIRKDSKNPKTFKEAFDIVKSQNGTAMFLEELSKAFKNQLTTLISSYENFNLEINTLARTYQETAIRAIDELNWNSLLLNYKDDIRSKIEPLIVKRRKSK